MKDKYNKLSFLAYINNPMSWEAIYMVYNKNNIKYKIINDQHTRMDAQIEQQIYYIDYSRAWTSRAI